MTQNDIPSMYQLAETQGADVHDLRLSLGSGYRSYFDPQPSFLDQSDVDWVRVSGDLLNLSRHVPGILESASKNCPKLEGNYSPMDGAPIEKLMTTLYAVMERWYESGNGLRQLTVPTRNEVKRFRGSTEFLEAVMKFCPQAEYLDGWKKVVSYRDAQCEEMWVVSLDTWAAFNAKCTNVRTFSWAVVPFAEPFIRVFGDHVKPKLETLSLSANRLVGLRTVLARVQRLDREASCE